MTRRETIAVVVASFLLVVLLGMVLYTGLFATASRPALVVTKDGKRHHCTEGLVLHSYGWMICAWTVKGQATDEHIAMDQVRSITFR
jgi:hypothetical protein